MSPCDEVAASQTCSASRRASPPTATLASAGSGTSTSSKGPGPPPLGVRHAANLSLRAHRLGAWLTDRSAAEGSWADRRDPARLFAGRVSPILCLVHPNNWVGGPALWRDRVLSAAPPEPQAGQSARVNRALRTRRRSAAQLELSNHRGSQGREFEPGLVRTRASAIASRSRAVLEPELRRSRRGSSTLPMR